MEQGTSSVFHKLITHPLFLLVVGLFMVLALITGVGAVLQIYMPPRSDTDLDNLAAVILLALTCIGGYFGFTRFVEHKAFTDFAPTGALREWLFGAGIGTAAMAAVVGVIALLGGYTVTGFHGAEIIIAVLAMAISSGIIEEILFRGLLFRFLEQWLGSVVALGLSALLFGMLHLSNPGASWLAAIAIALEAGILLGAIYMLTRRLWAVIGLHMAWNTVQGGVFGIKVSGTDIDGFLISKSQGSDLLTGGAFGAEASLPAILICTSIGLYFLWRAAQMGRIIPPSWHRFKTGVSLPVG
jgi:uncharacterized protein